MKKVDRVEIKMNKQLCTGAVLDEQVYFCELLKYDGKNETLYFELKDAEQLTIRA